MDWSLLLDLALAGLLAACLYFCWRLDRRLAALRSGQDGLRAAARDLAVSVAQAEAAVRSLRAASDEASRDLEARIREGKALAERLGIGAGRIRSAADVRDRGI